MDGDLTVLGSVALGEHAGRFYQMFLNTAGWASLIEPLGAVRRRDDIWSTTLRP